MPSPNTLLIDTWIALIFIYPSHYLQLPFPSLCAGLAWNGVRISTKPFYQGNVVPFINFISIVGCLNMWYLLYLYNKIIFITHSHSWKRILSGCVLLRRCCWHHLTTTRLWSPIGFKWGGMHFSITTYHNNDESS